MAGTQEDRRSQLREGHQPPPPRDDGLRRILMAYGIGALFVATIALIWFAYKMLLIIFAGILVAILLHDASLKLQQRFHLRREVALASVVALILLVLGVGGWMLAPSIAEQTNELVGAIPRALQRLQASFERYGMVQKIMGNLPSPEAIASNASSMLTSAGVFFSGVMGAIANVVIIAFIAIYFSAKPSWYINGFVGLFPQGSRPRTREVLYEIGHTLSRWLMGKLLSMVIVGVFTAAGLALLGVPLALVLGILAGLLDFIPYIGPILAGVPAVLIAFTESPLLALYVVVLFIALQLAEGYLLLPLIERRTVDLPPALIIIVQMIFGAFFGLAGVALATPLAAVIAVLVAMLYQQDVLGDRVKLPGEH